MPLSSVVLVMMMMVVVVVGGVEMGDATQSSAHEREERKSCMHRGDGSSVQ